jgi:hypothetical protein
VSNQNKAKITETDEGWSTINPAQGDRSAKVHVFRRYVKKTAYIAAVILGLALLVLVIDRLPDFQEYGLPISLGSSSAQVRKILGGPDQTVNYGEVQRHLRESGIEPSLPASNAISEWYYSSGIVATFDQDQLYMIGLPTDPGASAFLPYTGIVIRGVRLTDNKQTILKKLGAPQKIENDPLAEGVDPNVPAVFPAETRYYWRFPEYMVEADFLLQAQELDETHARAKNTLIVMSVRK